VESVGYNAELNAAQMAKKPWMSDAKYFKKCRVSHSAAIKMLQHALAGVDAGQDRGSKPLEIMGLLLGRTEGESIVVLDSFPLPVEGSETKVMADDEKIMVFMTNLSEQIELSYQERLIGWYHSHPFDVKEHSNCFLSQTDIQTQLMWQRGLDPRWVAIVIDPLRSLQKKAPDFGAFRAYPPEYKPPKGETPEWTTKGTDALKQQRWGKAFDRYYSMKVEIFTSKVGVSMLRDLSKKDLWIKALIGSDSEKHKSSTEGLEEFVQDFISNEGLSRQQMIGEASAQSAIMRKAANLGASHFSIILRMLVKQKLFARHDMM